MLSCVCVCVSQVLSRNVFKDYLKTSKNYYGTEWLCSNYKDYRAASILPFNVAIYVSQYLPVTACWHSKPLYICPNISGPYNSYTEALKIARYSGQKTRISERLLAVQNAPSAFYTAYKKNLKSCLLELLHTVYVKFLETWQE